MNCTIEDFKTAVDLLDSGHSLTTILDLLESRRHDNVAWEFEGPVTERDVVACADTLPAAGQ